MAFLLCLGLLLADLVTPFVGAASPKSWSSDCLHDLLPVKS